jgi:hypothetical protein
MTTYLIYFFLQVTPIEDEDEDDVEDEAMTILHEPEVVLVTKPSTVKIPGSGLTIQKQQAQMLMERRKQQDEPKVEQQITTPTFWCSSCPYNNQKRELVEQHLKRHQQHAQTDLKSVHQCCYCDYFATQPTQLKEHMLLHFRIKPLPNSRRAVTYTKYDDIEVWALPLDQEEEVQSKIVFSSKGVEGVKEDEEESDGEEEDDEDDVQIIDLRTGEVVTNARELAKSGDQALVAAN